VTVDLGLLFAWLCCCTIMCLLATVSFPQPASVFVYFTFLSIFIDCRQCDVTV